MEIVTEVSSQNMVAMLIDNTSPFGETNHDRESNAKLREVTEVAESIVSDFLWVYQQNKDRNEASMKEAADIAKNALLSIKEDLEDLSEED
ncbi:hypothetical protein KGP40_04400 [Weissella cibaria]|uniref:hypothetical protein n=1 Tax=Weissella cibaria TaxID=137591 RepID=UPI001C1F89B2|nr:hypothetical protein [Weissella cibaria]MBU7561156.1 hypothetical protein [Weissella cibaria]